ncbi:MAG: alkaline phosphatase family protein [Nitrospirota bacterium]
MGKLMMIGIDGATLNLIVPWVKSGYLPNIGSFIKDGVYGELDSTTPYLSPVAWTSLATGVRPAKHGVIDFVTRSPRSYDFRFTNAAMRKSAAVWNIFNKYGKRVSVINMPCSFPPDEVDGIMISGLDAPRNTEYITWPKGLLDEIKREIGHYTIDLSDEIDPRGKNNRIDYDKVLAELHKMIDNRTEVVSYLMKKYSWDFMFPVFIALDRAQHFYWHFMENNYTGSDKLKRALFDLYSHIDDSVGKLIKLSPPDTTFFIVSDHGFGPLKGTIFLNNWFIENGYLKPLGGIRYYKGKFFGSLPILITKYRRFFPKHLRELIKKRLKNKPLVLPPILEWIDWRNTKLFFEGQTGSIYINLKGREPFGIVIPGDEYEKLAKEVADKLTEMTDPLTKKRVVKKVYRGEEIYGANLSEYTPDLLVIFNEGYEVGSNNSILTYSNGDVFGSHCWSGCHNQKGVFMAKGESIKKGVKINMASIIDVAPTLLYASNIPVPTYMDGKVLLSIFNDAYTAANKPAYEDTPISEKIRSSRELTREEEEELKKRLEGLGYL